jgi:hypothetical protein
MGRVLSVVRVAKAGRNANHRGHRETERTQRGLVPDSENMAMIHGKTANGKKADPSATLRDDNKKRVG